MFFCKKQKKSALFCDTTQSKMEIQEETR